MAERCTGDDRDAQVGRAIAQDLGRGHPVGAWIALGLVQDPATERIEKDMEGARVAIDCIAFLVDKIEATVDDSTRRELKNLVKDLRLNFVQQQARP